MIQSQALNILFALCGITGAVYGIGRKLIDLEPQHIEAALFVRGP